jgi:UDPglucose 6-dehydrogenase
MNDYQKQRFVERVIGAMFNTVSKKRVAVLGFAFKKDTGDTRETPAIDVCRGLLADGARVVVYDPKVQALQVFRDLSAPKFAWDRPYGWAKSESRILESVQVAQDPYEAAAGAHAVLVLTEWDEFRAYDWRRMYDSMMKPAFVFDGRNLLDHAALRAIGFVVYCVGKPLDPFLTGAGA